MHGFGPHARSPAELAATRRLRASGTPFLELRDASGRQRLVPLAGERMAIGRAEGCGVALPWDPEASRLHAVVERIDDVWVVADAGSRNGTMVDGEPVSGRKLLEDGAVIRAGRTEVLFQSTAPGDAARTEAAAAFPVPELTAAQRKVLEALCRPWVSGASALPATNREIAAALVVSEETVKSHMRALFAAFDLTEAGQYHKRAELARRAVAAGLVPRRAAA
ncbi:MAG TPA: FHA domain-containing protein [Solirubrobacteraceae bacterium]|nr:FHA domain-containing protein [Solirubrobacteraceae bacterium]